LAGGVTRVLLELGLAWIQDYWRAFRGDRALLIVYLVFMPAALDGVKSGSGSFGGRKSSGLGFTAQAAHRDCMRIFLFTAHSVSLRTSLEEQKSSVRSYFNAGIFV
jgi:hypothetical protein